MWLVPAIVAVTPGGVIAQDVAQRNVPGGGDAPARAGILQIDVIQGSGVIYPLGSRATQGITVEVTDELGKPVDQASVTFQLPNDGPTGAFTSGSQTETITTSADGRAEVWGMQWNRTPGPFEVRITAAKGPARAGTVTRLQLTDAMSLVSSSTGTGGSPGRSRGGGHAKLWIVLAIAGAAGAAVAAGSGSGSSPATAAAAVNAPQIGAPSIIIGQPGGAR